MPTMPLTYLSTKKTAEAMLSPAMIPKTVPRQVPGRPDLRSSLGGGGEHSDGVSRPPETRGSH